MNTSDFSVIANNLSAGLQGAKSNAKRGSGKATGLGVDAADDKGNPPGKFPKLKLVKGGAERSTPDAAQTPTSNQTAQPVVFDSLLAQIEKKIQQDPQFMPPSLQPEVAPEVQGQVPSWPDKSAQINAPNLVQLKMVRSRAEAAAPPQLASLNDATPTTGSAQNRTAPQVVRNPSTDGASQATGLGKIYSALNSYLDSMQEQGVEPQSGQPVAAVDKRPQADHQPSGDGSREDQDKGSSHRKAEAAMTPAEAWPAQQGVALSTGTQGVALGATAALPITAQVTSALKAELLATRDISAPDAGPRVITVRLSPEGMGQLSIRLEKVEGALKVNVAAEHEATTQHLKSDSATLVSALEGLSSGFSSGNLSFSTMNQQEGDFRQNANQNGTNSGIAGNEQRPHQQSQEQAATKNGPQTGPISVQGGPAEVAAGERRGADRKSGSIYL